MIRKLWPALFLLTASCAYFVNTFDPNRFDQDAVLYSPGDKKLYCEKSSPFQLVNSNPQSQKAFARFVARLEKNVRLKFVDKAVLWSLIQMNLRPDLASPTSKLQILLRTAKGFEYFHFYAKEDEAFPYLSGLDLLLKRHKSSHSLSQLAALIDRYFPDVFAVNKSFEDFLSSKRAALAANPVFKRFYMRADETLKENEKIHKFPLSSLLKLYAKKKGELTYEVTQSLFSYESPTSPVTARCNYDMRLYSNSVYLIHKNFIRSHLFAFKEKGNAFLAGASQRLEKIAPVNGSIFFKGASQTRSAAFCAFEFPKEKSKDLWLVSSESRDPGQHIYHLIEYGLDAPETLAGLSELIGFSRHLFLEDPTRLVFESNRGTKEQLERLLKLNIPVYNARKLGILRGMLRTEDDKGFVVDDRGDGEILCGKK